MPHSDPPSRPAAPPPRAAPAARAAAAAVRRALRGPPGRVAVRVAPAGGEAPPAGGWAAARALVRDLARDRGGEAFDLAGDALLLVGAPAAEVATLRTSLRHLLDGAAELTGPWMLPADGAALLAWLDPGAGPATAPLPAVAGRDAAGLDALLESLPLERVARRRAGVLLMPGDAPRLAFRHLALSGPDLARALADPSASPLTDASAGPLAAPPASGDAGPGPGRPDPDLHRHARAVLARRLLRALATPDGRRALLGEVGGREPVHLDASAALLGSVPDPSPPLGPVPPGGLRTVAVLPLDEAADLAPLRATLRARGWGLAVGGIGAAALDLLDPAALAADWVRLRWSPAMGRRPGLPPGLDPATVVLAGCDGPAALAWGRAAGIVRFSGPAASDLLAAARQAACPAAAACPRAACAARAEATGPAERAGCAEPRLLAASFPDRPGSWPAGAAA